MYAAIIFLYYFNDLVGAVLTAASFTVVTLLGSLFSATLPVIWYGMGLVAGALTGFCVAYDRLRTMEKNMDIHIFCKGSLLKKGEGKCPSNRVYENKAAERSR